MEGAVKVHEQAKADEEKQQVAKEQVAFLNIFFSRLWFDLHQNQNFIDLLREKITRKLLKIKVMLTFIVNFWILIEKLYGFTEKSFFKY